MDWVDKPFLGCPDGGCPYTDHLVLDSIDDVNCSPGHKVYTFKSNGDGQGCVDLSDVDGFVDFMSKLLSGELDEGDHIMELIVRCRNFGEDVGGEMLGYSNDILDDDWCKFRAEMRIECDCTRGEDYGK